MDLSRRELVGDLASQLTEPVYWYVVDTIEAASVGSSFVQSGCGLNFQGGQITLSTCMHRMRTWHDVDTWKKYWIACFSGGSSRPQSHGLVCLWKVGLAFGTQAAFWNGLPERTRLYKSATLNYLGDVYEPLEGTPLEGEEAYDPDAYVRPATHVHLKDGTWRGDIDYEGKMVREGKVPPVRQPANLVAEESHTYVWRRLKLCLNKGKTFQGARLLDLEEFLDHLEETE